MRETRLHISTRILSMLLAILLMLAAFLACAQVTAEAYVTGTVTEATKMYDGRGTSSTHFRVVAALDPGDAVTILGNATGSDGSAWYQCCIPIGGTLYYGCVKAGTLTKKTFADTDTDFENYMNAQGFPDSYKPYLRVLHAKYPSWVFVADQTGLSWDDVIAAEIFPDLEYAAYKGVVDVEAAVRRLVEEMNRTMETTREISRIYFRRTPFDKTASGKIIRKQVKIA